MTMTVAPHVAYRVGQLAERIARCQAQRHGLTLDALASILSEEKAAQAELAKIAGGLGVGGQANITIITDPGEHEVGTVLDTTTGEPYVPPAPALALVPPADGAPDAG